MSKIVIVGAARTAVGTFGGTLKDIRTVDLGITAVSEALKWAGVSPSQVDDVIMGTCVTTTESSQQARMVALGAGMPFEVHAVTINKNCSSGMYSIFLAAQEIKTGDADIVVAGGMENMSKAPYMLDKARWGYRMGEGKLLDGATLYCPYNKDHIGITAENLAEQYNISRLEQDEYAYQSQMKAVKAIESGRFVDEIVPITIPQRKGDPIVFAQDEFPKPATTMEGLAKLPPFIKADGTITPGNSSGLNDGAAAVVLMTEEKAAELGLKPLAEIVSYAVGGVDPKVMGIGPVPSSRKALDKAGLTVDDLDLIELNEAFAAQAIAVNKDMGWDLAKLNVNGGAIALGHAVGSSGARITVTLLYEMMKRQSTYGLATLCVGGGEGTTLILKRMV